MFKSLILRNGVGCTVAVYRCDGCMAEDHVLLYLGEIVGRDTVKCAASGKPIERVVIRVVKEHGYDIRDRPEKFKYEFASNLQSLTKTTYAVYT